MNAKNYTAKDALREMRLKKGRSYLIWFFVFLAISYGMYTIDLGGALGAIVSLVMVVLFLGGLGYLIAGLATRTH